ncbi:hypothetical protein QFC21_001919 [Naganishia friedmannii]|uniref:Uncharacterized protein n=1 Tax=Naganishia friedmannii TaxID=89922 RepID=A0ACC2VY62_9TREE|nr:hypothetical protein QFC21_001919 [Naganishia friedmannii]
MGLSNFRQTWKRDSAWGRSVPEVPDDHCELPRNTIATRFDGNHGAWMAPLGLTALVLCVLATISTPLFPPMTVIEMVIKPDYPGGSGTSQKVQIGLWGLCWDGEDGISFGLMIGFCQKVKDNLALSDMKDFVDCKLGCANKFFEALQNFT